MSKITILRGLPASGKSTLAKSLLENGAIRVNKDSLRTMLHFDKWSYQNEKVTKESEVLLASHYLKKGRNVIVDDTNLTSIEVWVALARSLKAHYEVIEIGTPVNECIRRDGLREKSVGQDVIINMALRTGQMTLTRPVVLCDLDGTLCNIEHRLPFVKRDENKDWKSFFEGISKDSLREGVAAQLEALSDDHEIIFVSARPEDHKEATLEWLDRNVSFPWLTLIMRKAGDHRPDTMVKQEILNAYFPDRSIIKCVFDDRPSVIRMWREQGLEVVDVGNGIEF